MEVRYFVAFFFLLTGFYIYQLRSARARDREGAFQRELVSRRADIARRQVSQDGANDDETWRDQRRGFLSSITKSARTHDDDARVRESPSLEHAAWLPCDERTRFATHGTPSGTSRDVGSFVRSFSLPPSLFRRLSSPFHSLHAAHHTHTHTLSFSLSLALSARRGFFSFSLL